MNMVAKQYSFESCEGQFGKIGWILSREYGISLAEVVRRVGVCTSAIAKAIQKMEKQKSQV